MIYNIRYTPTAQMDMDAVWDGVYEASRSFDVADRYINGLMEEISSVRQFPRSGIPLIYRGLFTGFYSVNFKAYKAFYRIKEDSVEVLRVIMAKRDYIKILFG